MAGIELLLLGRWNILKNMWAIRYPRPFEKNVLLPFLLQSEGALVTQSMMQCQPNPTELRSMNSYVQILYIFQKSKQKVPPPSLPCIKKSPFTPPKEDFLTLWEGNG